MANTLEHLCGPVSKSLAVQPAPITLVLRNQTVTTNGHVKWAPRKMCFYTYPTQDYNFAGTNDWLNLLAVHEFRHVAQGAAVHRNFNRLTHWAGGDLLLANLVS